MNYRRKEIKALIASSNTYLVFIYLVFSFVQDKAAKAPTRRLQSGIQFIQFSFQSKYLAWLQALGRYACGIWISLLLLLSIKSAGKLKFSKIKESGKVQLEEGASFDLFLIDLFTIDLASFDLYNKWSLEYFERKWLVWQYLGKGQILKADCISILECIEREWEEIPRPNLMGVTGGGQRMLIKKQRAHTSKMCNFFKIVCSHTTPQSWWRISERCLSTVGNFQVHNRF